MDYSNLELAQLLKEKQNEVDSFLNKYGSVVSSSTLKPPVLLQDKEEQIASSEKKEESPPSDLNQLPAGGGVGLKGGLYLDDLSSPESKSYPARFFTEQEKQDRNLSSQEESDLLSSLKTPSRQTSSFKSDSLGRIKSDVENQPVTPAYAQAYSKLYEDKNKFIDSLANERVWMGNTSRPLTQEEKEERYDRYEKNLFNPEALESRAKTVVEEAEKKRELLTNELQALDYELEKTTNPFVIDRLNRQKASLVAKLSEQKTPILADSTVTSSTSTDSADKILADLEQSASAPTSISSATPPSLSPSESKIVKPSERTISAGEKTTTDVKKEEREEELTKIIGAQAAREVSQYEDLMSRFREAQERERGLRFLASAGRAGEKIGAAIAGVKPGDSEFYKSIEEYAGQQIPGFEKEQEARREAEKNDPNSPISQEYRNLVASMDIKLKGNESAASLIKAMPFLQQYQSQKEARRIRSEERAERDEEKKEREEREQKWKRELTIGRARQELTSGKIGELRQSYVLGQRGIEMLEQAIKNPSGYKDLAATYLNLKATQGDASVIREAEMRLGLSIGSIPEKMHGKLLQFFTGQMYAPEQRKAMLESLKLLTDQNKRAYLSAVDTVKAGLEDLPGMTEEEISKLDKKLTSIKKDELSSSEQKKIISLPEKSAARLKPGQTFDVKSTGKTYRVNADGKTATEL